MRDERRRVHLWTADNRRPGASSRQVDMARPVEFEASLDGVGVLLVEDHPVVRVVVTRLLEEYGARVTGVPGVPEALESLRRDRPDVLVSDIEMPGEDGYALIRKVRALPADRGGQIPAAALTCLNTARDRDRALRAGFQCHVAKPIDARELVAVVRTLGTSTKGQAGRFEGAQSREARA